MSNPTTRQHALRLATIVLATVLLAACDQLPTNPNARRSIRASGLSSHGEITDDTLTCISGYVVVNGRYVCN